MVQSLLILMHLFALDGQYDRASLVVGKWLERAPGDSSARTWLADFTEGRMPDDLPQLALRFTW